MVDIWLILALIIFHENISRLPKYPSLPLKDLSRKTREARQELRKFLTFARKINPEINGFLRYDRLFIDGDIYHYDELTKNVELLR